LIVFALALAYLMRPWYSLVKAGPDNYPFLYNVLILLIQVRPMHHQFVEPSKRHAHIIVPVGLNSVALDLVVSKLRSEMELHVHNDISSA
jgi:hypothetical protein